MEKIVSMSIDSVEKIKFDDYSDEEFAIARMGFLSTKPNSHGLKISEDVLRKSAKTVLGKWVVAYVDKYTQDATTHVSNEGIVGNVPKDQDVEFVYDKDGYLRAYVDTVISKVYAKDYCRIFANDNNRAVSVEMKCAMNEEDEDLVEAFNILGVTTLGKTVKPSCPDSNIEFIRFAEAEANKYYKKETGARSALAKFVQERENSMAKTYKIDKSKEAMSTKSWGDVDKEDLRNKIMEANNKAELVKACYMLVEDGWEDAPSQHLKYPVMNFEGDTLVYNRDGLASALGYAKKENETTVINKVEKIYKDLDLDDSEGKEDKKMSEIDFAAVNIGNLWGDLWEKLHEKYPDGEYECIYRICDIFEEGNQKFALIRRRDEEAKYRLDFSLTEDGLELSDEIVKVEIDIVETDEVRKFAEPENAEQYKQFAEPTEGDKEEDKPEEDEDKEAKMSEEDMVAKIAELEGCIEEKENIIMDKDKLIADRDAELEELRAFKASVEEKEKATAVEKILSEMAKFMDKDTAENLRKEGLAVDFAELDAWSNKVKASAVDKVLKTGKTNDVFEFAAPVEPQKRPENVWDRL